MKIFSIIIKSLFALVFLAVIAFIATFFLYIFMPENVSQAIEYFKKLFNPDILGVAWNIINIGGVS